MHCICNAPQRWQPHRCHLRGAGSKFVNGAQLCVDQLEGVHLLWIVHQLNRPPVQEAHFTRFTFEVVARSSENRIRETNELIKRPQSAIWMSGLTLWTISVRNRAKNWNIIVASIVAMMQRPVFGHLWVQSYVGRIPPSLYRLSSAVSHRLVWCDRCLFRNRKLAQCMHHSYCCRCHCHCWSLRHFP